MTAPNWYGLLLLGLAAFRTWKLLGEDTILGRPRAWLLARFPGYMAEMVECPYCLGAWISFGWWGGWQASPHWTLVAAAPFAISTLLVAAERLISGPS